MKMMEMNYYEGDKNEILWRWSKWNIMKVIKMKFYEGDAEMKYYEGDQNEVLWTCENEILWR